MEDKLSKKDFIELHKRILKELVKDENGKDILNFDIFSANCCLVFNSKNKPKKMIYDENLYYLPFDRELEIKNALAEYNKPSGTRQTSVAEERIERHDDASFGGSLGMAAVGITSPHEVH